MSPEYFHNFLTIHEAEDYIEGLNRRYRAGWEQTKIAVNVQAKLANKKNPNVIGDLPWEKAEKIAATAPPTKEQLEELKAFARKIEKLRNNG